VFPLINWPRNARPQLDLVDPDSFLLDMCDTIEMFRWLSACDWPPFEWSPPVFNSILASASVSLISFSSLRASSIIRWHRFICSSIAAAAGCPGWWRQAERLCACCWEEFLFLDFVSAPCEVAGSYHRGQYFVRAAFHLEVVLVGLSTRYARAKVCRCLLWRERRLALLLFGSGAATAAGCSRRPCSRDCPLDECRRHSLVPKVERWAAAAAADCFGQLDLMPRRRPAPLVTRKRRRRRLESPVCPKFDNKQRFCPKKIMQISPRVAVAAPACWIPPGERPFLSGLFIFHRPLTVRHTHTREALRRWPPRMLSSRPRRAPPLNLFRLNSLATSEFQ
jgi:hypothetical protein